MSSYKNPLEFNSKLKPYDRYVEELRAWCIVTDLAKEKHGVAVALSLVVCVIKYLMKLNQQTLITKEMLVH